MNSSMAARERNKKRYPRLERYTRMMRAANLRSIGQKWRDVGAHLGVGAQRARELAKMFERVVRWEKHTGKRWVDQ